MSQISGTATVKIQNINHLRNRELILFEIWPKLKIFKCWQNFEKDEFWPNVGKCSLPIMELCLKKVKL